MHDSELYGFKGLRDSDQVVISALKGKHKLRESASDPNLRDRLIEFIEDLAEEVADTILAELDIDNDEEEDYDRYNAEGDLD